MRASRTASALERPDSGIELAFRERTQASAALMSSAGRSMPGGSTRNFGSYEPYPVVFERGEGPYLWDVDGHRYVDLTYNALSLIHGHAFPPVMEAIAEALPNGTAWPGASRAQIDFAELLCRRIPTADLVRFTNTGTEAVMLAVKVARHVTGRPLVIKSRGAYHGSYDDLEAGLYGIGELPGRTLLGNFGDLASFERAFAEHGDQIAAVVIEPMLFAFEVVAPPPGFLSGLVDLAHGVGAAVILDDCLMFRLAEGGSAEKYGIEPDLTCLGKFIGGGVPVGVVAGRSEWMAVFNPRNENGIYHGGSFNGNPLGSAAGRAMLQALTAQRIQAMDARAVRLSEDLRTRAGAHGLMVDISGDASVLGFNIRAEDGSRDRELGIRLQLAGMVHGVYFGQGGEIALATVFEDETVDEVVDGLDAAMGDLVREIEHTR
jgi:glutamate-1-semialdehyde 2,1-aminomutase